MHYDQLEKGILHFYTSKQAYSARYPEVAVPITPAPDTATLVSRT